MPFSDLPGHYRQFANALHRGLGGIGQPPTGIGFGEPRDLPTGSKSIRAGPLLAGRYGPRGGLLRTLMLLPQAWREVCGGCRVLHWTDGLIGVAALSALLPVGGLRVVIQLWGRIHADSRPMGAVRTRLVRFLVRRRRLFPVCETVQDAAASADALGCRVHILPYPVDWPRAVGRELARSRLALPAGRLVILLFGVRRRDKAISSLLEAQEYCPGDLRPIVLIAGPEAAEEFAASRLTRRSNPDIRAIPRYLTPEEVALVFAACDAVALPYPPDAERGSGVLWDAVHFGRPLLVPSGRGLLARLIARDGCGLLYERSDPRWMEGVCRQLIDPEGRRRLAEGLAASQKRAPSRRYSRRLAALYRAVQDRGR